MTKKKYAQPSIEALSIEIERGIAASTTLGQQGVSAESLGGTTTEDYW
ncbi:MAG: hypothetical protein SOZ00_07085 [Tidjanibacter sp.]|nr:hypothetical protein [Tidjanibacter sp.]